MTLARPEGRFHTIIEQRVSLGEIDNIDSYHIGKVARVLHAEIKPLKVAASIRVVTHPQVVLNRRSLPDLVDIPTFKVSIKFNMTRLVFSWLLLAAIHINWPTKTVHFYDFILFFWKVFLILFSVNQFFIAWVPDLIKVNWLCSWVRIISFSAKFWCAYSSFSLLLDAMVASAP